MARPKTDSRFGKRWTTALQEKYESSLKKLKQRLAVSLRQDVVRLIDEEISPDLELVAVDGKVACHKFMLAARMPGFSALLQDSSLVSSESQSCISTSGTQTQVAGIIRKLYTEDDSSGAASQLMRMIKSKEQHQSNSISQSAQAEGASGASDDVNPCMCANLGNMRPHSDVCGNCCSKCDNLEGCVADGVIDCDHHDRDLQNEQTADYDKAVDLLHDGTKTACNSSNGQDLDGNINCINTSQCRTSCEDKNTCSGAMATEPNSANPKGDIHYPLSGKAGSALGDDLLQMLDSGMLTDLTACVQNQTFQVHRALLCCRSEYFSAMLGGAWCESNADEITLEGVSPAAVDQILQYIYGAAVDVVSGCSLTELTVLSDMYGLLEMRGIIELTIKAEKCHFFHKPCQDCVSSVSEMLPLMYSYGLMELLQRALCWTIKNLSRVASTKAFGLLPDELLSKCLQTAKDEISTQTVFNMVVDIEHLLNGLTSVHWAQKIRDFAGQLREACIAWLSIHISDLLHTRHFMNLAMGGSEWGLVTLENVLTQAIVTMAMEKACHTYMTFRNLEKGTHIEHCSWSENFCEMIRRLKDKCEEYLRIHENRLCHTRDWELMSKEMIRSGSNGLQDVTRHQENEKGTWYVSFGDKKPLRSAPVLSNRENRTRKHPETSARKIRHAGPMTKYDKSTSSQKTRVQARHQSSMKKSNKKTGENLNGRKVKQTTEKTIRNAGNRRKHNAVSEPSALKKENIGASNYEAIPGPSCENTAIGASNVSLTDSASDCLDDKDVASYSEESDVTSLPEESAQNNITNNDQSVSDRMIIIDRTPELWTENLIPVLDTEYIQPDR